MLNNLLSIIFQHLHRTPVYLSLQRVFRHFIPHLIFLHSLQPSLLPVTQNNFCLQKMIPGTPVHQRMRTARIISHHSSQTTTIRSRSLRPKEQSQRLYPHIQFIQHYPRFNPNPMLFFIYLQHVIHIPRHINDHPIPYHLSR